MKVFLTGGTGFLGRHIAWRLVREGCEVVFTGRNPVSAECVLQKARGKIRWLPIQHGEHGTSELLTKEMVNVDAVVHCAGLSSPWGTKESFRKANILGTEEILNASQKNSIKRLVHISTPSIYFHYQDQFSILENQLLPPPVNDYAWSKAVAEKLVNDSSIPERVILRPRAIFGEWDMTLLPRLIRVINKGRIPIIRGGAALIDVTYVENVVEAVWLSLIKGISHPVAAYNVSNGTPISIKILFEKIASAFGLDMKTINVPWRVADTIARILEAWSRIINCSEPLITRYGMGVLAFGQTLDLSAIRRDLGYEPKVTIEEGIARYAQWWKDQNKRSGITV